MRHLLLLAFVLRLSIVGLSQDKLSFEVVSVRPCKPNDPVGGLRPLLGGQRYVATCVPLKPILWVSYWVHPDQIVGGPDWIDKDAFYIEGLAPQPSSIAELHVMMQNAVADRFNLRFHREKKELDAYVLTVDKSGPKNLTEHAPASASDVAINPKVDTIPEGFHEVWTATSSPMDFFVWRLGTRFGRPVVDQTGLPAAGYDFVLSWDSPPPTPAADVPDRGLSVPDLPPGPTIFEALRDQFRA